MRTPEPMMAAFLLMLQDRQGLFSWQEFEIETIERWREIYPEWTKENVSVLYAVQRRLGRNCYPSGIDSLYAWARMVEKGWYDSVIVDSARDAFSKHDLVLTSVSLGNPVTVGIRIGSKACDQHHEYKVRYRNDGNIPEVDLSYRLAGHG